MGTFCVPSVLEERVDLSQTYGDVRTITLIQQWKGCLEQSVFVTVFPCAVFYVNSLGNQILVPSCRVLGNRVFLCG